MELTATDLFCGAGGLSLGAERAGVQLRLAANHDPVAVDVHQVNFPHADHDCADISQVDPRRYRRTDILLAGPECTNHANAKGVSRRKQQASLLEPVDPGAERSRATMWDVHRFVEEHRYDACFIENIVEAASWTYWPAWCQAWRDAKYNFKVLSINSAHTGLVHQWRCRIYVAAWRIGLPEPDLDFRPPCWCPACEKVVAGRQAWKPMRSIGRWRRQYDWRCPDCHQIVIPPAPPAEEIVDWSLPMVRIGDKKRPLVEATRRRIGIGLREHGGHLVQTAHKGDDRCRVRSLHDPHPTVCASDDRMALVLPYWSNGRPRPVTEPLGTVTANGNHHALLMAPQSGGKALPIGRPAPTVVTKATALLVTYNRTGQAHPVTEPASTVTTKHRHAVVEPAPEVDDCLFRMLEPHESGRAMAFPQTYKVEGRKKVVQRLYGNAVTPPVVTWGVGQLVDMLRSA